MKKTLALILAALMLLSISLVACDNGNGDDTTNGTPDTTVAPSGDEQNTTSTPETEAPKSAYESSLDLYTKIWAAYGEDNKFACGGGDAFHENMEGPGAFILEDVYETVKNGDVEETQLVSSADDLKATLGYITHLTDDLINMIDVNDMATLVHMMNTNTFSSAVVKLNDSSKTEEFAESYKSVIQGQRWMCGFPDKVIVISVDNYLILAFGHEGNVDNLVAAANAVDASAKVLVDAPAMVE